MDTPIDIRELLRIAWRRKWFFLVPAAMVVTIAAVLMFTLPRLYESTATLLIDRKDVPDDIVPSLSNEVIEQRLKVLTYEIMSNGNLSRIAHRHDLYPETRETMTQAAIANLMRQRIETDTIVAEYNDSADYRAGRTTFAFQITFADTDPRRAEQVTNELVSAYLAESMESMRARAERTTSFVAEEREHLDARIAELEDAFTAFKTENRELLPEAAALKQRQVTEIEQQLRGLDGDLRTLRERRSFLETQLALTNEFDQSSGAASDTPEGQLQRLRSELATAEARYSSTHPDVVRLRREVSSLSRVVDNRSGSSSLAAEEAALSGELAQLRERYTDAHPDVRRVEQELAAVRGQLARAGGSGDGGGLNRSAAYVQLSAQLNSVEAEIEEVEQLRLDLRADKRTLEEQLTLAPAVEREHTRLQRRLDNLLAERDALADRETTARLSGSFATSALGDRLTLAAPPSRPTAPSSPSKKLIVALGLVLATGSGGASVMLAELLDRSIRSASQLAKILGDSPLCMVPTLSSPREQRRRRLKRLIGVAVLLAAIAGAMLWIHHVYLPLDIVALQATAQVEQWVGGTASP